MNLFDEYKKWAKSYKPVDNRFSIPTLVYDSFEAGFKLGASPIKLPNQEVADLCSCKEPWPFASQQYSNRCKTCGLIIIPKTRHFTNKGGING